MKTKVTLKKLLIATGLLIGCAGYSFGRVVEIRSYNLKPGTRNDFHALFLREAMPMLNRWKINVIAYGPSIQDENSYFLMRSYNDLEDLERSEGAFYGSDEWKKGPRESVLSYILSYTTVVVPADSIHSISKRLKLMETATENSDMAQLRALNAQFIKNFIANDTARHNRIIHKDFVYISSEGKIVNREDYMKRWAHGYNPEVDKSFEYKNEVIRIFGDMALVRSNTFFSWMEKGKLLHGKTVYTDTYIKENGKWLCVQAQITDLK